MPTESLFLANKERSIAILSIASSNCDNVHHFAFKIELFCQDFESHGDSNFIPTVKNNSMKFETHVARLPPFDVTLHDFQNLGKIIQF